MNALLVDIDGVLYQGGAPIPGAAAVVSWLQTKGIPHLFLTNTSSIPRRAIREKLRRMEIAVDDSRIFTPAIAAASWLARHNAYPAALFLPEASAVDLGPIPIMQSDQVEGAASVILGDLGQEWDFTKLNRAFRLLMSSPTAFLIALGLTRYWQAEDGLRLDVGPFVRALEYATGREAIVTGKPSNTFFQQGLEMLGVSAKHAVMVGDDIVGDINGAQEAGLRGVLVKTGKYRSGDLIDRRPPDAILPTIAALPAWWDTISSLGPDTPIQVST